MKESVNWTYLSLMRFVLSLIVLFVHLELEGIIVPGFSWLAKFGGYQAVICFLIISGFSIAKSLEGKSDTIDFYKKRIMRIYPVYIVCFLFLLFYKTVPFDIYHILMLIGNVFFLQTIIFEASYLGPAWSLALEFWLYMLAPYLNKLSFKKAVYIGLISYLFYIGYLVLKSVFHLKYFSLTNYGVNFFTLSCFWIVGFIYAKYKDKRTVTLKWMLIFSIAQILFVQCMLFLSKLNKNQLLDFIYNEYLPEGLIKLCFVVTLHLIMYLLMKNVFEIQNINSKLSNLFHFLGNISYPLYLVHMPILFMLKYYSISNVWLYAMLPIIVSMLLYRFVDFYSYNRKNNLITK